MVVAQRGPDMTEECIIEIIRQAYLSGVHDKENGAEQWCRQGNRERAEELFSEFKEEDIIK